MKILVVYTVGIKSEFEILFRGENVLSDHLLDNNETEEFSKTNFFKITTSTVSICFKFNLQLSNAKTFQPYCTSDQCLCGVGIIKENARTERS
jgi:hypothetical protein